MLYPLDKYPSSLAHVSCDSAQRTAVDDLSATLMLLLAAPDAFEFPTDCITALLEPLAVTLMYFVYAVIEGELPDEARLSRISP